MGLRNILLSMLGLMLISRCTTSKEEQAIELYQIHCASCHLAPSIQDLPKSLWEQAVLPEMAARMGLKDSAYSPYHGYGFPEQEAMMKTGIYSVQPSISEQEWNILKAYIIAMAPDSLPVSLPKELDNDLKQFSAIPINVDSTTGSLISFLDINTSNRNITIADLKGNVMSYDHIEKELVIQDNFGGPITGFLRKDSASIVTMVGNLNPSEIAKGRIINVTENGINQIGNTLHRPVYTEFADLNGNGKDEILVSEFGHLSGQLKLLSRDETAEYEEKTLLYQPGSIKTVVGDMNDDGLPDIIALSGQGNEGITIFYQESNLEFRAERVLRFSPVYGSSWFELVDYDGDGHKDLITVNGDNADKTYVHKPYHGLRIFMNDGSNNFEQHYFYPLNGATRVVAEDFDEDGDVDLALLASFPDYDRCMDCSFVFLENLDSKSYHFKGYTTEMSDLGRWLLLDSGDIDEDGDIDIVLSSFTYSFTPVPKEMLKSWRDSDTDILILENRLH